MARSKTSQRWLKEHFDDPCVKMAQKDGYRSRASYKLLEIQEKDMTVVDLGAAPGGWSQVTSRVTGDKGRLIASDILEMDSIPDVTFIFHRKVKTTGFQPVSFSATMRGWRASAWITDTAVIRSTRSSITLFG